MLENFLFDHALQLAVVALVEPPCCMVRDGRMLGGGEFFAGLCSLGEAIFGKWDVGPAGEAVAEVPFAFAVAKEDQCSF